ncbi:hypothetical protein [Celeribacter neptunius]|uniref:Uncharacterized protein n=1 Tax=Celeribacter neptunius TaxID=588602 RepID=A0A1I3X325_9RHOB|nr:hypothetical protein [Celeribacter neptunius]SFK14202.1 hypothetical protein SAMN04487991_3961 [Celeribacter neptunius]
MAEQKYKPNPLFLVLMLVGAALVVAPTLIGMPARPAMLLTFLGFALLLLNFILNMAALVRFKKSAKERMSPGGAQLPSLKSSPISP